MKIFFYTSYISTHFLVNITCCRSVCHILNLTCTFSSYFFGAFFFFFFNLGGGYWFLFCFITKHTLARAPNVVINWVSWVKLCNTLMNVHNNTLIPSHIHNNILLIMYPIHLAICAGLCSCFSLRSDNKLLYTCNNSDSRITLNCK